MSQTRMVTCSTRTGALPVYRPIEDYGVIGDCRSAALIGPDGSIDWCCLPHFDSPAIFCRLLDAAQGGSFRLAPAAPYDATMTYLDRTNVLQTTFATDDGRLTQVDLMPVRRRQTHAPAVWSSLATLIRRGPRGLSAGLESALGNDVAAAHRILRLATCQAGTIEVELTLQATFDYARQPSAISLVPMAGEMFAATVHAGNRYLVLLARVLPGAAARQSAGPLQLTVDGQVVRGRIGLQAGDRVAVALNYARGADEARTLLGALARHDFDRDLDETLQFWRDWLAGSPYDGPYRESVLRSALALKLCTFEPTGAIVAAPTTSLPESPGGPRNWDYRYTWLRDSAFTLDALGALGFHDEARDYFHFLHDLHMRRADDFRIMYGIRGEAGVQLAERDLTHLDGYRGSRPVRIGNGAAKQRQLDVYGELLDAAYRYVCACGFRQGRRVAEPPRDLRVLTAKIADYITAHWQDLDQGIWEIRGAPRAFVYSRVMCWVALDRACKMARLTGHTRHEARWSSARDAIREDVLRHGVDPQLHAFTQAYGDAHLDAANLRIPDVGFLPPGDTLAQDTVRATAEKLAGPHGLLYRYEPSSSTDAGDTSLDGLPGKEGAFLACTFWLIRDLCGMGQIAEARARFEQLLGYASPLGLYSEEVDPHSGALLGNYPQAFTHIGLINCAVALQQTQSEAPWPPRS